jgi:hypothetical protein
MKKSSLQDQLLKAGLSSKSKAHKVSKQKHKQQKQQRKNKAEVTDEAALLANQAKAKHREKDRLLNEKRNAEAEKKQIAAQITQLINLNKLPKDDDGVVFNFTDENLVKGIYIPEDVRERLIKGGAVLVKLSKSYEVVPVAVAEKIAQRDKSRVIYLDDVALEAVDDGYADYEIPDDLMW